MDGNDREALIFSPEKLEYMTETTLVEVLYYLFFMIEGSKKHDRERCFGWIRPYSKSTVQLMEQFTDALLISYGENITDG